MMKLSIIDEFSKVRPQYEAFTHSIKSVLENIFEANSIEFFSIEARCKSIESLAEKIVRDDKAGKYAKPEDITDLSGIRIIAYLQQDCDKICKILKSNFDIDEKNSTNKSEEIDPDKFGYLSTHYVVSLPKERSILTEYSRFTNMKCEIQVRTLLQYTWAAIDWKFRYKEERQAPKDIRRRLFRISALLEAADNEFSAVKTSIDELAKSYADSLGKGMLNIPIDTESLKSYIKNDDKVKTILNMARSGGVDCHKLNSALSLGRLADTCAILGIETLEQLDDRLGRVQSKAEEYFKHLSDHRSGSADAQGALMAAAIIRYLLIPTGTTEQANRIFKKAPVASAYVPAIKSFMIDRNILE